MFSAWRWVAAAKPARPAPTTMTPVLSESWEREGIGLGGETGEGAALIGLKDLNLEVGKWVEEESGRESAASDIFCVSWIWIRIW